MFYHMFRAIMILLLILPGISGRSQYFDNTYDFDGKGIGDRFSTFTVDGDTIFAMARHLCDSLQQCISLVKMNWHGDVYLAKPIDFLDPEYNPIIIEGDYLYIADGSHDTTRMGYHLYIFDRSFDLVEQYFYPVEQQLQFISDQGMTLSRDHIYIYGFSFVENGNWPGQLFIIDRNSMQLDTIIHDYKEPLGFLEYSYLWPETDSSFLVFFSEQAIKAQRIRVDKGLLLMDHKGNYEYKYVEYDYGLKPEYCIKTRDNGYVFEVENQDFNGYSDVRKLSADFSVLWTFTFEPKSRNGNRKIFSLSESGSGDILGAGSSRWYFDYSRERDNLPELPNYESAYIVKIDGETGEKIWAYNIIVFDEFGNVVHYALTDFQELPDGSLLGVGGAYIFDEEGRIDDFDSWAVRLDSNGCIIPECGGYEIFTTGMKEVYKIDDGLYSIAPNPAVDHFRVINQGNPFDELRVRVRSIDGKVVLSKVYDHTEIYIGNLPSGIYFVEILNGKERYMEVEKMVISR